MTKPIRIKRILLTEKNDGVHITTEVKYLHNENMPANTKYWLDKDGQFHRDDGKPALITKMGSYHWYYHGIRHRDNNNPAIIYCDGSKRWYKNGKKII